MKYNLLVATALATVILLENGAGATTGKLLLCYKIEKKIEINKITI